MKQCILKKHSFSGFSKKMKKRTIWKMKNQKVIGPKGSFINLHRIFSTSSIKSKSTGQILDINL